MLWCWLQLVLLLKDLSSASAAPVDIGFVASWSKRCGQLRDFGPSLATKDGCTVVRYEVWLNYWDKLQLGNHISIRDNIHGEIIRDLTAARKDDCETVKSRPMSEQTVWTG
jgi:hypothetical protein